MVLALFVFLGFFLVYWFLIPLNDWQYYHYFLEHWCEALTIVYQYQDQLLYMAVPQGCFSSLVLFTLSTNDRSTRTKLCYFCYTKTEVHHIISLKYVSDDNNVIQHIKKMWADGARSQSKWRNASQLSSVTNLSLRPALINITGSMLMTQSAEKPMLKFFWSKLSQQMYCFYMDWRCLVPSRNPCKFLSRNPAKLRHG